MADLTVKSIPVYFGTMAAEYAWLRRRARRIGPGPADFESRDLLVSLSMGTASILTPIVLPKMLAAAVLDGRRIRRPVLVAIGAAIVVTTVADRVVARTASDDAGTGTADGTGTGTGTGAAHSTDQDAANEPTADRAAPQLSPRSRRRGRLHRAARATASIGGVTATALGLAAASAKWRVATRDERLWARRLLPDLGTGPLPTALAVFGWDFIYYWNHRLQHESRFMWAIHVVHHSSERYNLGTALRQPVSDVLGTFIPPGLLSVLGIRPQLVRLARDLNLLYQYWIHTEVIDWLGPAERVLNTPSHHRAHHGSNHQYLDRNHGSILIVWDRLFGTFEEEDERVRYGLTRNIGSYNPITVATHEHVAMFRDVALSTTWRDRLSFMLRGPGWAYSRRTADGTGTVDAVPISATAA